MQYAIIKYAQPSIWQRFFKEDPAEGVHISYSAANTYTGKRYGLQESYTEEELTKAKCHLDIVQENNPMGYYAICKIIPEKETPLKLNLTSEECQRIYTEEAELTAQQRLTKG